MTELNLQVGYDTDDLWLQDSNVIMICPADCPPYIFAGESDIGVRYGCGVRFRDVTIPHEATIEEAYLTFNAVVDTSTTVCNTRIWGEDTDNPDDFSGEDATSAFARRDNQTTAIIDWDGIASWTENSDYQSPELKTIIQELVDRNGWRSGNALVLFWDDTKDSRSTTATRGAHSHNDDNARATKLYIKYTGGSGYAAVYPTEAITRVTNLVHRYNRKEGEYSLTISLGEVTSDFGLPQWLSKPQPSKPEERSIDEVVEESVQAAVDKAIEPEYPYTPREVMQPLYEAEAKRLQVQAEELGIVAPTARTIRIQVEESDKIAKLKEIEKLSRSAATPGITSYARDVLNRAIERKQAELEAMYRRG